MTLAKNIFVCVLMFGLFTSCESWRQQNFNHRKYLHLKKLNPSVQDELMDEPMCESIDYNEVEKCNHEKHIIDDSVEKKTDSFCFEFDEDEIAENTILNDQNENDKLEIESISNEIKITENPPDIPTNSKRVFFFTGGGLAAFILSVLCFFVSVPLWLIFVIACVVLLTWGWVLSLLTIIQGNELSASEKTNNIKWNLAYCWFVFVTGCLFYLLIITMFIDKRIDDYKKTKDSRPEKNKVKKGTS